MSQENKRRQELEQVDKVDLIEGYLLRVANPATVSTYAFVNPVIAFFLGVVLANEPFTPRTLLASGIILAGVVLITVFNHAARPVAAAVPAKAVGD